jgi:hypothetical protein
VVVPIDLKNVIDIKGLQRYIPVVEVVAIAFGEYLLPINK